jgi:hypothetical protein
MGGVQVRALYQQHGVSSLLVSQAAPHMYLASQHAPKFSAFDTLLGN